MSMIQSAPAWLGQEVVRRAMVRLSLVTVLSLAILTLCLKGQGWQQRWEAWSWPAAAAAVPVYLLMCMTSGGRLRTLCRESVRWPTSVATHGMGACCRSVLPAGLGELAYVALLRQFLTPTLRQAFAVTLVARVLDVAMAGVVMTLLLPLLTPMHPWAVMAGWGVLLAPTLLCVALCDPGRRKAWLRRVPWLARARRARLAACMVERALRQWNGATLWRAAGLTVLLIGLTWLLYATICLAVAPGISLLHVTFVFFMLRPIAMLPIKGFFDLGSHEAGWVGLLVMLGWPAGDATLMAVQTHLLLAALPMLAALVGGSLLLAASARSAKLPLPNPVWRARA